jgi:hypothetical protein
MQDLQFAAIELKAHEHMDAAIRHVMDVAVEKRKLFAKLDVFGPVMVGRYHFLRFRSDCRPEVLEGVLAENRAVIVPGGPAGYTVKLPKGRTGNVNRIVLQASALTGFPKLYRGPAVNLWERQFLTR